MFTPQEVSEKVFPKASFGSGGYSMASVDEFLDALTEDYTALFKENVTLKAKLKVLAEKVEEYRSTEEAMRQALLTAQKMATKLVQDAQVEKEQILSDARAEAQQEIHRLDDERQAAERKLQYAQEKTAEFIRRSEELCKAHSAFLLSLPELDFAPEKPAAAPAAAPKDDVVSSIEQDILSHYADAEPAKNVHGPSSSRSARLTVRTAFEKLPGSRRESASSSAVIYVPRGLPSACSPSAFVIFTTVMRTPCRSCSRAATPESCVCSCAERSYSALASIARSVLGCIDSPPG